jgi:uncharacterized protein (DUF1810 family)
MENSPTDLSRFLDAQENDYDTALQEIKNGRKRSHWMWYIFPQIAGLAMSEMSRRYAIKDMEEAEAYLNHPVLGKRLVEISNALLQLDENDPHEIFGSPDDMKLRSCTTLFAAVEDADPVFNQVLDRFFDGTQDQQTLTLL